MIADPAVKLLVDAHADVGEGPFWHAREGVLYWVDIPPGLVHRYDPATGQDSVFHVGQTVGAARPRASGGLVLAVTDGFASLDTKTGKVEMLADAERDRPDMRMNDGACDSSGRFWAGTMPFNEHEPIGALYRLDADLHVNKMVEGVTISNGIAWSLDDRTMYYIDSATKGVDAFDYDAASGSISNRRRVATITVSGAVPDGMTIDSEGYLWVALWGGWGVHRFAPDGTLDRVIALPVAQVSACTFGGPDLQDLYVTSAARGRTAADLEKEPHAGGLFVCRPGVTGRPTHSFKG